MATKKENTTTGFIDGVVLDIVDGVCLVKEWGGCYHLFNFTHCKVAPKVGQYLRFTFVMKGGAK